MKIFKKAICIVILLCFCGTDLLYALDVSPINLAAQTRFTHQPSEFQETAHLQLNVQSYLEEAESLSREGIRKLGVREVIEKTKFGNKAIGTILFDVAEEIQIPHATAPGYLVKAKTG